MVSNIHTFFHLLLQLHPGTPSHEMAGPAPSSLINTPIIDERFVSDPQPGPSTGAVLSCDLTQPLGIELIPIQNVPGCEAAHSTEDSRQPQLCSRSESDLQELYTEFKSIIEDPNDFWDTVYN